MNIYGRIAHSILHNRPLATIIFLSSLLLGIGAFLLTPKQYNPQVTLPAFSVQIEYPNATAKEVEELVTKELEEKISDIPGVDTISSYSFDGGMSMVQVSFVVGTSLESARVALQSKITENRDLQKGTILDPIIKTISPDDVPILEIGLTSPTLSQNAIREKAVSLVHHLQTIEGVANLSLTGGEPHALHIILDPNKLKNFRVSAGEVYEILLTSNVQMLAGSVKNGTTQEEVYLSSPLSQKEIQELSVSSGVRLSDIATISEGYSEIKNYVQVVKNNKRQDAVILSIAKREGENGIIIAEKTLEVLEEQKEILSKQGIFYEIYRNEGETASEAIFHLGRDLIISIAIVVLLLLFFLGKRESLIVAIAIPLTLGLVFLVGYLFGQTINRITLFALILALGLLVDDAIVVVENIHRHLKKGEPKKIAIVNAVNEVGVGLFLCTTSAIIVFLPLTQITGMMGPYMGPLSFFVPWALAMSLLVAYILTPFLADVLLEEHSHQPHDEEGREEKSSIFEKIAGWYAHSLRIILNNARLQKQIVFGTLFLLFLSFLIPFVQLVHFKMLPKADKDQIYVYLDAEEGTDFPKTHDFAMKASNAMSSFEEVKSIEIFTSIAPVLDFNGLFKGAHMRKSSHQATLRVNLFPVSDRSLSSEEITLQIRKTLLGLNLPVHLKVLEDPPGPPVMATLLTKVQSENETLRNAIAKDLEKIIQNTKEVVDIDTSLETPFVRHRYEINYTEVRNANVSIDHIAKTLWIALSPQKIVQYYNPDAKEMAFIELSFPFSERNESADIEQLTIQNTKGEIIPLMTFLKRVESVHEPMIVRDEKIPTVYITGEMGKRSIVYASIDILWNLIFDYRPPNATLKHWNLFGVEYAVPNGETVKIAFGGEWEMTLKNFRDLGLAMMGAMFLVYILLVAQFRSFSASGLIMLTVPMALIGIIFGFVLLDIFGIYLTATALIGFVALIGLVVKNGILFLEYYDYQIEQGIEIKEALIEAGRIRLQPIVLTSLTAILANLTIVQDPVWSGLAWAIVFGLSISTVLSLIIFPLVYAMVNPKR